MGGELPCRPQHGQRIDADVMVKPLVLVGQEHCDELRIDGIQRRRETPAPFVRRLRKQQGAVPVEHLGRHIRSTQRRRIGLVQRVERCGGEAQPRQAAAHPLQNGERPHQRASTTST